MKNNAKPWKQWETFLGGWVTRIPQSPEPCYRQTIALRTYPRQVCKPQAMHKCCAMIALGPQVLCYVGWANWSWKHNSCKLKFLMSICRFLEFSWNFPKGSGGFRRVSEETSKTCVCCVLCLCFEKNWFVWMKKCFFKQNWFFLFFLFFVWKWFRRLPETSGDFRRLPEETAFSGSVAFWTCSLYRVKLQKSSGDFRRLPEENGQNFRWLPETSGGFRMEAEKIHTFSEIFGKVWKLPKSSKRTQIALKKTKKTKQTKKMKKT